MAGAIFESVQMAVFWSTDHLLLINILLSFVIIFFQRREPKTVWTWLLVLYFIPILGFVLYLMIGQDFRKSRMFRMKEIEGELKSAVWRQEESIFRKQLCLKDPEMERFESLILYNLNEAQAVLTDNNDVRVYTDGLEKFQALVAQMEQAKKYIHLQYYIIRKDELWAKIEEVLIRKVKEGVEVRVLFDSMGCRGMRKKDWRRLECAGIKVAEFFPAIFGKLHLRMNYRNHRKIVVIDGRVGFVGGFNIGREYLGLDKKFGYWRDTHLCMIHNNSNSVICRNRFAKPLLFFFILQTSGENPDITSSLKNSLYTCAGTCWVICKSHTVIFLFKGFSQRSNYLFHRCGTVCRNCPTIAFCPQPVKMLAVTTAKIIKLTILFITKIPF